jgi:TonB family protein
MSKQIAFAMVFAASLAAAQEASVATLIQSAEQAVRRGQYAEADVLFAKAAARGDSPEIAPALWYLGARAAGSGNRLAAEGFFERLLKADSKGPHTARALTWLANLRQDEPAAAEPLYRQALTLQQTGTPEGQATARAYAFFLRRQGRREEADALDAAWRRDAQSYKEAAKTSALPAGVFRVGGDVKPPSLVRKVEPQYTNEARDAHIEGTVVLSVDIDATGAAANIEVLRSVEPGLDGKAMEAVRQWQFRPGTKDGAPVTVRATIEVNFRLS